MRILWVKYGLLHPVNFGGRIRSFEILSRLARRHHVTYVALDDGVSGPRERELAAAYCRELVVVPHRRSPAFTPGFWWDLARNLASPDPYFVMAYRSDPLRRVLEARIDPSAQDVVVCDFPALSPALPSPAPVPTLLFEHNVEAEIWRRLAETTPGWAARRYLRGQWVKARRFEGRATQAFDGVVAVSDADAVRLRRDYAVPHVRVVPTGVDAATFAPRPDVPARAGHLVFTGALDWLPNQEGLLWFLAEVWPRIRRGHPGASLGIVGKDPMGPLRRAVARCPEVLLTGRVDDVRPFLAEASVVIVPLRVGGGTRLKIFEAMSMDRPVVSTRIGAEGLPLVAGEEIRLADSPDEFAAEVLELLAQPEAARTLGARGGSRVRRDFDWDRAARAFEEALEEVGARRRGVWPSGAAAPLEPVSTLAGMTSAPG